MCFPIPVLAWPQVNYPKAADGQTRCSCLRGCSGFGGLERDFVLEEPLTHTLGLERIVDLALMWRDFLAIVLAAGSEIEAVLFDQASHIGQGVGGDKAGIVGDVIRLGARARKRDHSAVGKAELPYLRRQRRGAGRLRRGVQRAPGSRHTASLAHNVVEPAVPLRLSELPAL